MLRSLRRLRRLGVHATDGTAGGVHDVYFDDRQWTVRHLVVDARRWLPHRVLVSPLSVRDVDWSRCRLDLDLTTDQLRRCPGIASDKPVWRQHAVDFHDCFSVPYYWLGSGPGAEGSVPDPDLCSARFVIGLEVEGADGPVGHVEDFLFDDDSWAIRYMLVNTGRLWPGRRVLVSPAWIAWVSWLQRNVRVDLSGETIRNAPAYDVSRPFTAHDEARLLTYYESREPGGSHERDALASRAGRPPRH